MEFKKLLLGSAAAGMLWAGDFDEVRLRTRLAGGPLGGVLASGTVDFRVRPSRGDKSFNLEVEDVNLPAGTTLQVWVNNEPIGRIVVSGAPAKGGELELNSRDGAAVPSIGAGDVVSLRNASGVLLSGVLQRRALDDSPVNATPMAAQVVPALIPDDKRVLRTPLTGGGLAGVRPSGEVEFREDRLTNSSRLFVEVENVNLREGTELEVEVSGRKAGKIRLQGSRRGGELELDSRNGERVDASKAGDMIRIIGPSGAILAGALQTRTFDDKGGSTSTPSSSSGGGAASSETRVQSPLAGGAVGGVKPSGSVDFRVRANGADQKFNVEVEDVNLPAGTVLNVFVGDKVVGQITVGPPPMRGGELEISTRDGGTLPEFGAGAVVSVRTATGGVVLTGVVQAKSFTAVPALPGTKVDDSPKSGSGSNSGSGSSSGSGSNSGSGSSGSGSSGSGSSGSGSSGSGSSGSGSSGSGSGSSGSGSSGSGSSGSGSSGSGSSGSGSSGSGSDDSGSGKSK